MELEINPLLTIIRQYDKIFYNYIFDIFSSKEGVRNTMPAESEKFLLEGIFYLTFILVLCALVQLRFSKKISLIAAGGTIIGVILLQSVLLTSGQAPTLVLTLLPLTAYLPAIVCLHILSRSGFFQTTAIWTTGFTVYFVLKTLWKILMRERNADLQGWSYSLLLLSCLTAAAAIMTFLVFRFLRKPFQTYVLQNNTSWLLLCFPVLMVFLLFSYVRNSTTDGILLVLLLLTAFSIFLILIRVLTSAASITRLRVSERAVSLQMRIQRREYEDICKKMELGRNYRHDMRHHLTVLDALAKQGDTESIIKYIGNLNDRLNDITKKSYCENPPVNAVLSSCIGQAEKSGCYVTAMICLPGEIPFDEMDICVVLANALENANNACMDIPEKEKRRITLNAELKDNRKLIISVENPCGTALTFNGDGFPIVPERKGHGIGLKSIDAVTRKYNGMFRCECENGKFRLNAVLFSCQDPIMTAESSEVKSTCTVKRAVSGALLSALTLFLLINCLPTMSNALEEIPILGPIVRLADLRSYRFDWGDSSFDAQLPVLDNVQPPLSGEDEQDADLPGAAAEPSQPGNTSEEPSSPNISDDGVEEMNQQMGKYIEMIRQKFLWYFARKYEGYVASDTTYRILRNDDRLLSVRFETTLNAGGSAQYSRSFTLDKQSGKVLGLAELFLPDSNYADVISKEILRQMTAQVESGEGDYFIPGGIWSDDECFKEIDADQNFYIDGLDRLVIVFDEYEVAPGSMGMPEFAIAPELLEEILLQPSVIG